MLQSKIEWTEHTWNPWQGCKKVSEGCVRCYMYRHFGRWAATPHEGFLKASTPFRSSPNTFNMPLKIKEPGMVFTCSLSDFFIKEADEWRADAWDIIRRTPHLTYQILTKRPENILTRLPSDWGDGYPNVWLGTSAENQHWANIRIPLLLQVPAAIHFVSAEPLLGDIDFMAIPSPDGTPCNVLGNNCTAYLNSVDWLIVGGESGNKAGTYKARPCPVNAIIKIVEDCKASNCKVFVKQLGTSLSYIYGLGHTHGGDMNLWPSTLNKIKCRQFPQ